jgi:hypothetical protein
MLWRIKDLGWVQVPMSKFEQEDFIDDRYKKMDERLQVSRHSSSTETPTSKPLLFWTV